VLHWTTDQVVLQVSGKCCKVNNETWLSAGSEFQMFALKTAMSLVRSTDPVLQMTSVWCQQISDAVCLPQTRLASSRWLEMTAPNHSFEHDHHQLKPDSLADGQAASGGPVAPE